jgi:hypothetical protein
MSQGIPTALILGIDYFVAKKLAESLVEKDIHVVGVGEMIVGLSDLKNFEGAVNLDEVNGEFDYVFDFGGDKNDWRKIKGEKLVLISVDNETRKSYLSREAVTLERDWRIVEALGVYGEKMGENNFLAKVIKQAVRNKNLELPDPNKTIRLLAIEDLVEAILRACFLSGTAGEYFLLLGKEITFEQLAKILMDKAKMTRFKVMEIDQIINQGNEKLADESEKQLRWKAEISFDKGIESTLQYFFSLTDEENRRKKEGGSKKVFEKINKNTHEKLFDILVEESEESAVAESFGETREEIKEEPKMMVYDENNENFDLPSLMKKSKKSAVAGSFGETREESDYIEEESEEIEKISNDQFLISKKNENKGEVREAKKRRRWKGWKYWWVVVVILLVGLLIEPVRWCWVTNRTIKSIKEIPELIKNKKYNQVEILAEKRIKSLEKIDGKISELGLNVFVLGRNYQGGLKILMDFLVLERSLPETVRAAEGINLAIFKEKQIDWTTELNILKNGIIETENNIGLLQARLSGDYSWLPAGWRSSLQKGEKVLEETREKIALGKEVVNLLPEFLGLDGKERKYMILFQNESELRPTGGFIGSYGLINFQGGKLISFEVKDVYEADGQLEGHVEPPWEIKTHLNEANWYMRDANWKADFMKTGADIQWFLEKETGKKVDGVIGIDLAVAKSILGVIGEIYVPDFNEKITADNLYEQAEFYTETKFFPGSVQKASFLGGLGKQMFEEIKNLEIEKAGLLVDSMLDLLQKNEIQIAANNSDLAKKINALGWDGKIYNGKCSQENCLPDYWYLVEANLGVNKANYFIQKGIEEVTEITNTGLNRTIRVNYENTAKNSNWPGGDYKNYVRIYLPKEVELSQISVADGYDASVKKVYVSSEINIKEVDGKKEVGFLVTVPVLKKRILEIKYSSSLALGSGKEFAYMKYIQKQPGTGETSLVSLISYPENWQPLQVEPTATIVGGKLLFNLKLDEDVKMGVVLGR